MSASVVTATSIASVEEFARQAAAAVAALNTPEELAKDHFGSERTPAFDYAAGGAEQEHDHYNWCDPVLAGLREYLVAAEDIADKLGPVRSEVNDKGTVGIDTFTAIPVPALVEGSPDATIEQSFEFFEWGGVFEWDEDYRFTLRIDGKAVLRVLRVKHRGCLNLFRDETGTPITLNEFFELWRTYFAVDLRDLEAIR